MNRGGFFAGDAILCNMPRRGINRQKSRRSKMGLKVWYQRTMNRLNQELKG